MENETNSSVNENAETSKSGGSKLTVIVKAKGKQFRIGHGDTVILDRLASEAGEEIVFGETLLAEEVKDGQPLKHLDPSGITVKAKVISHILGPKVRIFKKKRRTGYTKRQGHRQQLTKVQITEFVRAA